jgi:cystathionine beta-lyase/cystathionine gamma-synthase
VRHCYPDAYRFFQTILARLGVTVAYVDGRDREAVAAALPGARLLYLESPTSWTMEAHDARELARLAKYHGVLTVMDNSWATPVFQRPLTLGVDLVLHSASKYLSGHSDVVAGAVAGSAELVGKIRSSTLPYLGGKLSPLDAWLIIRGLRTLPVRMKIHEADALTIARRLAMHEIVARVDHPGLGNSLPPNLDGTSGLFSFVFKSGIDIRSFINRLKLFRLGVSWGGHESLAIPASILRVQAAGPNSALDFGVDERSVRLHVGLEGADALWNDLSEAIDFACRRYSPEPCPEG